MERTVTYVNFHDVLFVPGVGNLGNTLPSQSKTLKLHMSYEEGSGVLKILVNGVDARVPIATAKIFVLAAK